MTIDNSKLIPAIESYLKSEYVGKSTTSYPKNYSIIDVRCEIDESTEYLEDDGGEIIHRDFKVEFLVTSPKDRFMRWIDADISF